MTTSILVFVVESAEPVLDVVEEALKDGGYSVTTARNGEKAIAKLDAEGANYKALVTEVDLPGKTKGWDVARHAREINDSLPVVYLTGAGDHEWASKGVPNSHLMTKPFAMAQLVTAVSQLINAVDVSLKKF